LEKPIPDKLPTIPNISFTSSGPWKKQIMEELEHPEGKTKGTLRASVAWINASLRGHQTSWLHSPPEHSRNPLWIDPPLQSEASETDTIWQENGRSKAENHQICSQKWQNRPKNMGKVYWGFSYS